MSFLKINEDLFLEKQELNRLQDFLGKLRGSSKFLQFMDTYIPGVIKTKEDFPFLNFKIEAGSQPQTIKLTNSYALDKNLNLIYKEAQDNILIPNDGNWYWIKIAHQYSPVEEGIVDIDAQGVLTGFNTKFFDVIRGIPNFPSKIKFYNSSNNFDEYEVLEVLSNTSATLSGTFIPETGLRYSVIGTFSEDFVPPNSYKEIFQYDSCLPFILNQAIVLETIPNTPPASLSGIDFFVARVKVGTNTMLIEDKRKDIWELKAEYLTSFIDENNSSVIGVESVKWDLETSPKNANELNIGWGFRSTNWSIESTLRKVTISSGEGGILKNTNLFEDGQFDGYRIYNQTGKYSLITESWKSGSQINLLIQYLNPDDFIADSELIIVPDVEQIEIKISSDPTDIQVITYSGNTPPIPTVNIDQDTYLQLEFVETFDISLGVGKMYVKHPKMPNPVLNPPYLGIYKVKVEYRYKTVNNYGKWKVIPDDESNGFYDESSFYPNGEIKDLNDRVNKVYTDGLIEIIPHPNCYASVIYKLDKGDIFEVEEYVMPTNGLIDLKVGVTRYYQYIHGTQTLGGTLIFNLSPLNARNGNRFVIHIDMESVVMNQNTILIVEDYVNNNLSSTLKTISQADIWQMMNIDKGLRFDCIYDGTHWYISQNYDLGDAYGTIKMIEGNPNDLFTPQGWGKIKGLYGHTNCIQGVSGAPNLSGRSPIGIGQFTEGSSVYNYINGGTGGEVKHKLSIAEIPAHKHNVTDSGHDHQYKYHPPKVVGKNAGNGEHAASDVWMWDNTTSSSGGINEDNIGGDLSHENRHPWFAINYAKKMY